MRLKNIVRSAVAAGASLAVALGITACSRDYTVAYVYSVSASAGTISAFAVDYETGILNQIAGSPFATSFTNPTRIISAPNNKFIYVLGGSQNAQIAEYAVGTDGKIYGENTYNLTGTYPTSATIDTTGTFLYVTFTYQSGYSPASPGPGGVTIFPINSDNTLGTPTTLNVGNNPVGLVVSTPVCTSSPILTTNPTCTTTTGSSAGNENVYAYVLDQESTLAKPTVLGFAQNMTTGALTPLSGTAYNSTLATYQGYAAGVVPSAIAVDGTTRFVYVTDRNQNVVIGYSIDRLLTGNLTALNGSPFGTGLYPVSLTIDPRSDYLYTANFNSGSISSFAINQSDGNLSTVSGGTFTAQTNPNCITIEPALGLFLYVSNYDGSSISGGQLNANTGAVNSVTDSYFPTGAFPSCVTSVANGAHSTEVLTP